MGAARPQHNHRELPVGTYGRSRGHSRECAVHYVNHRSKLPPAAYRSFRDRSAQSPFSAAEEMELAIELLEVTSEAELEQFVGNLFKQAWRGIDPVGLTVGRPLGGVLKTVTKTALPFLATAAGTFSGGLSGGAIAEKLGSLVSQALEAEAAGMTGADRDLEKCRQFVRMIGKSARAAALAPTGTNPIALAQKVLATAAQEKLAKQPPPNGRVGNGPNAATAALPKSIPVKTTQTAWRKAETGAPIANGRPCSSCGQPFWNCKCRTINQSGRWMRQGRSIVIVNC
jgi:hypothetical protein